MTAQLLAAISGAVLSLILSYFPKLNTWFAAQEKGTKQLQMLGLLFLTAAGVFGVSCTPFGARFGLAITCDMNGVYDMLEIFFYAAFANQATFGLSKQTMGVRIAKGDPEVVTIVDQE